MRARPAGVLVVGLSALLVCAAAEADQASVSGSGIANTGTQTFQGDVNIGASYEQVRLLIGVATGPLERLNSELRVELRQLADRLAVTVPAVQNMLRTLGEQDDVPPEGLQAKLAEIAARHKAMLERLAVLDPEDPAIGRLIEGARAAIEAGAYDEADRLLAAAEDAELAAVQMASELARQAQEAADQRRSNAAATRAERGELALTRLDYRTAAEHFETAAELVPASAPLVRADYLGRFGRAAQDAGDYAAAEGAFGEGLKLRQEALDPEHPDAAKSLNNLAVLYQDQGRYTEAEPLLRRALAINEKALGPDHPNVALGLNNLAALYRATGRYGEAEPFFRRALAIVEKTLPTDHPHQALFRENYAGLLEALGRGDEATRLRARDAAARR